MSERIHWAWIILIASFVTVFTAYSIRLSYGILLPVCLFGVFYAAAWPMFAAAAADFFPREATGTVLGLWTIFYGLALILAPALGGYVADLTGTFIWPFFLATATGVLGVVFFSRVKKHDQTYPGQGNQKKVVVKNKSML
ncbi:MAG: MFS transporter [Deltaproteobacteria bacterium]|nr:MFS transporter [Deltaproteobacteria bacterium]